MNDDAALVESHWQRETKKPWDNYAPVLLLLQHKQRRLAREKTRTTKAGF